MIEPAAIGARVPETSARILNELSERPMHPVQIGTVAMCLLINLIDGFDVLAMAFAASSIGAEWQLSPTELGLLFSSGLAGMTISSLFLAPVADYSGRRTAILIFLVVISFAMAASALAGSVAELAIWRFVTGVGVGGLLPAINTMVAEFASRRRQELSVSIMQAGFPLGASVGGIVAWFLIEAHGWRSVFWVGAGLSSAMIAIVWWKLPESLEFLLTRKRPDALMKINVLLARLALPSIAHLDSHQSIHRQVGFTGLASRDTLMRLIPLCVSFLCVMGCFYFVSAWTPKMLTDAGFTVSSGISGGIILNVSGVLGGVLLAWAASGPRIRLLTIGYVVASAFAMAVYGFMSNLGALLVMAGVLGFFLVGAMIGLYSLTPALFPASARATATGFAIGVGRLGAMAGPVVTGVLIEREMPASTIYLTFALPLIVAGVALFILHHISAKGLTRPPKEGSA